MAPARPRSGPMRRSVDRSVPARDRRPEDRAAFALAQHYADLIDRAEDVAAYAALILDGASEGTLELDPFERGYVQKLARLVEAQTVAAELGPKLLAALQQLHLTTAARARAVNGKAADDDPDEAALLRIATARPGARVDDPPPVDPAAS